MRRSFPASAIAIVFLGILPLATLPAFAASPRSNLHATPPASLILTRAQQALQSKGSVHFTLKMRLAMSGISAATMRGTGDLADRGGQVAEQVTMRSGGLGMPGQGVSVVVQNKQAAIRVGTAPWRCLPMQQVMQQYSSLLGPLSLPQQGATVVGTRTISGAPVWHLRISGSSKVSGISIPLREDLFVSQQDYTLRRIVVRTHVTTHGASVHERVAMNFTRYGEAVTVQLPTQCGSHLR